MPFFKVASRDNLVSKVIKAETVDEIKKEAIRKFPALDLSPEDYHVSLKIFQSIVI